MLNLIKKIFTKSSPISALQTKLYINVPYSEKDEAKKLGAKWDAEKKSWYIPNGHTVNHFEKWIIQHDEKIVGNLRSTGFYIVESLETCWRCGQDTPVFSFLLPEDHQTKEYEDEDDDTNDRIIWQSSQYRTILGFVDYIDVKNLAVMRKFTSHYDLDFSQQSSGTYYMNHCTNCQSKLGDFYMHSEPGGAFQPMTRQEASVLKLYWFNEAFEAHAGSYSIDVNHFEDMQIVIE